MKSQRTQFRNSILLWSLIGGGLCLSFVLMFKEIFMPFVVAFIIAYILKPIVEKFSELSISRGVTAVLLVGGFLVFIIAAIFFAIPFVKNELLFLAQKLPTYVDWLKKTLTPPLTNILSY